MIKKILTIALYIYKNWYIYWRKFLTIIGDIKVFPKYPCFILYMPEEYDYKVRGNYIREIDNILKPGDIVLRHYDHYLDSWLIPGYYSHSSIYIGDHKIIHAVAEGIKEIDVIDFCQCDGVIVLRPNGNQEIAVERAKQMLGKEYDFKFDSTDTSAFYCHELTAYCYKELDIQTYPATFFGKELKLVKPKYLAESFLTNKNMSIVFEEKPENK